MTSSGHEVEVLVVGELNVDIVVSGPGAVPVFGQQENLVDDCQVVLGASSAIFACGIRRLGHATAMVGVIGDDAFGRVVSAALTERGVDISGVHVDPQLRTGTTIILNPGSDRALLTHLGTIGATRREHVPANLLTRARHLHVGSVYLQRALQPDVADLFDQAHRQGLTVSLDPNWDPSGEWTSLLPLLAHVDVAFVNEAEAARLTADLVPDGLAAEPAAYALAGRMRAGATMVVKRGAEGAVAVQNDRLWSTAALPVQPVDTTGAGDSFDAGFIHGLLTGADLPTCLAMGVACGSMSTRSAGGTGAQPDSEQLAAALDGIVSVHGPHRKAPDDSDDGRSRHPHRG